jgi:hypothetical protein
MRRLVITENFGQVVVETSSGVRAAGATVQSALWKLDLSGLSSLSDYDPVEELFARIRETDGPSQIGSGVASA